MTLKIWDSFHASKEPYNPKVIGCLFSRYKRSLFMVATYEPYGPRAIAREK